MLENIRLSFQGIWSHKMRSFLTMLGIIIGIGAIIAIVSTIQGTNEQIKQNLVGAGNNAVTVQLDVYKRQIRSCTIQAACSQCSSNPYPSVCSKFVFTSASMTFGCAP